MPPLENIDKDSFPTPLLAVYVVKLKFKPKNTYIIMECDMYNPSMCPCNNIINSFIHFLVDNPGAFSFDNG